MAKPRPCVVPCCQGEKFELVHKFPSDRERAELWKTILNVPELGPLDVDTIRGRHFVCSRHFRDSDYKNKISRSLNVTANPSLNLRGLCDPEGLNRTIPPMGRPLVGDSGSNVVTLSLEVQSFPTDGVGVGESDEKNMLSFTGDPLEETVPVQVDHHVEEQNPATVRVPNSMVLSAGQKRILEASTMAGSTPAKIFRFRKKMNIVKVEGGISDPEKGRSVQNDPLILKRVKVLSPQKTIMKIRPIGERKIETISVETQTDIEEAPNRSASTDLEAVEAEDRSCEEPPQENEKPVTSRVLALLECTPENLEKLKKKMSGGAVLFDENLFKEEEEDEAESAMQKPAVDERLFLTLKRAESDEPIRVSYIWLRDHCRCNECYNHETFQRSLSILDVPEDVSPSSYEIRDGALNVLWKDNHASSYDLDFIFSAQFELYKESLVQEHSQPALWDRELMGLCPDYCRVSLNELLCDDEIVKKLVHSLYMYGVAFIEKVPANPQSTEMAVRRIFPIHKTLFGEMWTFSDSMDHSDTAYTKNYLGPHTDNTYFSDASGLQVLHCIQFKGSGGQTILIDGFKAAEQLRLKKPEVFERLCNYPVTGEYLEEGKHHTYCAPIIKRNIITGEVEQLRFNIYDRAILKTIPQQQVPQFYADFKELGAEINEESMAWTFQLTPGTVMIFDNWRVLHGRMAYTGKRVMSGCYVARTDYQSVARTLGIIS